MTDEYSENEAKLESLYEKLDRADEHEAAQISKDIVTLRQRLVYLKMKGERCVRSPKQTLKAFRS